MRQQKQTSQQYTYTQFAHEYTGLEDLSKLTPMFRQYLDIRQREPECLLFYRLGDFYELFFRDAEIVSKELELILTGRDGGLEDKVKMCGVPHIAYETYLAKLVNRGYKVAICEQTSLPDKKGLVQRDIVRIVTQGTALESSILREDVSNYLCCVYGIESTTLFNYNKPQLSFGVAWADISTGQFNLQVCDNEQKLEELLSTIRPREIICNDATLLSSFDFGVVRIGDCPSFSKYYDWAFEIDKATNIAKQYLNSDTYNKVKNDSMAMCAVGALLEYIGQSHKASSNLKELSICDKQQYMSLNHYTKYTLELVANMRDGSRKGTLIQAINSCKSDMGKRKLNGWLLAPLVDCNAINARLDAVNALYDDARVADELTKLFKNMRDLERLSMRITHKNARPQDLILLAKSLALLPDIVQFITTLQDKSSRLDYLINNVVNSHQDIKDLILSAILQEPALRPQDGYVIADGYHKRLDELRDFKVEASKIVAKLEATERDRSGIKKLKIGYNRIIGYFIEVPKIDTGKVPYGYTRKQTMSNIERYTSDDLKRIESRVLSTQESMEKIEIELYDKLLEQLNPFVKSILTTADAIAEIDCYLSFATISLQYGYVRPQVVDSKKSILNIVEGRHPIVERLTDRFVPNDTSLDIDNQTMIITGPNMSGKSVYMRQVALIAIMAQIGSFVPALSCELTPITDIFARIGSGDDMLSGRSTFMVEMVELSTILNNVTDTSLVILDELGRGTATYDGISIAKAVVEHLTQNTKAFTLFSTHYLELTELESLTGCHNYQMTVQEKQDKIQSNNKLAKGGASKSFGIQVAALSGIPNKIIARANEILETKWSK
ncbi:MAG: DNA mismatch repair protein MutS [Firmicutes bacterium]|nr:DNA mismatch repair protein MutS [Bacillota bacterium]MCL1954086.1 DNA mismatch repair protein MutS [Bacillota bacterium]